MTSKVIYTGDLRTECEHIKSGTTIITDAPTDNHGKGESFSPTDTVATALASCMLTVTGIKAQDAGFSIDGATAQVTKTMASNPRRIAQIDIDFHFPQQYDQKTRKIIEHTCLTCPVNQSLHPDIKVEVDFNYG